MNGVAKNRLRKFASVLLGGLAWAVLAAGSAADWFVLGTIELLFLLAPLVIVPLGLEFLRRHGDSGSSALYRAARLLQPPGAALAVASFFLLEGRTAAGLACAWLLVCILVGLSGAICVLRGAFHSLVAACFAAGPIYLVVGGAWLVLSRLGASPAGFAEPIVLLTAVHFHYTGFALPLIAGATGRALNFPPPRVPRLVRLVVLGILVGPVLLAAGFVFSPVLKVCAAVLLAAATIGLSGLLVLALPRVRPRPAQALLVGAAGSLGAAMALAGVYAVGEFVQRYWLLIPQMARFHGVANGLGFTLCGLLAWTLESRPSNGTAGVNP